MKSEDYALPSYVDWPDFPMQHVSHVKQLSASQKALKEKEKADWSSLSRDEKVQCEYQGLPENSVATSIGACARPDIPAEFLGNPIDAAGLALVRSRPWRLYTGFAKRSAKYSPCGVKAWKSQADLMSRSLCMLSVVQFLLYVLVCEGRFVRICVSWPSLC